MVWEMLYSGDSYALPAADAEASWRRAMGQDVAAEQEVRACACCYISARQLGEIAAFVLKVFPCSNNTCGYVLLLHMGALRRAVCHPTVTSTAHCSCYLLTSPLFLLVLRSFLLPAA
jgi:hypothetical protein